MHWASVSLYMIQFMQVIQNLLDNAAKFMGEHPHPSIEIGYDGNDDDGKSILYVKDNGKGIADEQLDNVIRLFQKLDISTLPTSDANTVEPLRSLLHKSTDPHT